MQMSAGVSWSQGGPESESACSDWECPSGGGGQEAEVLSWILKITQHAIVKRRSYGSI